MDEHLNVAVALESYLSSDARRALAFAGEQASELDMHVYLVGGAVRDLLRRQPSLDLDLVCEGSAPELARAISVASGARLKVHERFGTARLQGPLFTMDIATARRETYTRPGALPTVQFARLADDLARRDFTINAMAIDLAPESYGVLCDPYGGRRDLEDGLIRVLHENSFVDDATRIWRAIRYEKRLNMTIEPQTLALLARDTAMLESISGTRIRHELEAMLRETCPENGLARADQLNVIRKLHPGVIADSWLVRKFAEARRLDRRGWLQTTYHALLLCRLPEAEISRVAQQLTFTQSVAAVCRDAARLFFHLTPLEDEAQLRSSIHQRLKDYTPQAIHTCIVATDSPAAKRNLSLYMDNLREVRTALDGNALLALGVPRGPAIGLMLHELFVARLDGLVKNRGGEAALVREWLAAPSAAPAIRRPRPASPE